MSNDDKQPEPKPATSVPPPRPPPGTIVGAGAGDDDSSGLTKPDYGCHQALWALAARYREANIHDAHSILVEQERLLREHIRFPGYRGQLAWTMIRRSEIVSHLGDAQAASSIMAEALSVMASAAPIPQKQRAATAELILKTVRQLEEQANVRWRRSDPAA